MSIIWETLFFGNCFAFAVVGVSLLCLFMTRDGYQGFSGPKSFFFSFYYVIYSVALFFSFFVLRTPNLQLLPYISLFCFVLCYISLAGFVFYNPKRSPIIYILFAALQILLSVGITVYQKSTNHSWTFLLVGFPTILLSLITFLRLAKNTTDQKEKKTYKILFGFQSVMMVLTIVSGYFYICAPPTLKPTLDGIFYVKTSYLIAIPVALILIFLNLREKRSSWIWLTARFLAIYLAGLAVLILVPTLLGRIAWNYAYQDAERDTRLFTYQINDEFERFQELLTNFAKNPVVFEVLQNPTVENRYKVTDLFTHHEFELRYVSMILIAADGNCMSANNSSLLNADFSNRDYFMTAMKDGKACTGGVLRFSKLPSFFIARRVDSPTGLPLGVVVLRFSPQSNLPQPTSVRFCLFSGFGHLVRYATDPKLIGKLVSHFSDRKVILTGLDQHEIVLSSTDFQFPHETLIFTQVKFSHYLPGWNMILATASSKPWEMHLLGLRLLTMLGLFVAFLVFTLIVFRRARNENIEMRRWRDSFFLDSPQPALMIDGSLRIVDLNDAMADMLGYNKRAVLLMDLEHIFASKEELAKFQSLSVSLILSDKLLGQTLLLRKNNSHLLTCSASGKVLPLPQMQGKIPSGSGGKADHLFVWFFTDESKLQNKLELLRESEELYKSLAKSSPDHMFMLDSKGNFLSSNDPRIASKLEVHQMNPSISNYFSEETVVFYKTMIENVFVMQKPLTFQHSIKVYDSEKYYHDTLYPIIKDGVVKAVGGISRDITAIKRTEESLKRSEHRFKDITRDSNDIIWETDQDGKISFCTENIEVKLGYKPSEILGVDPMCLLPAAQRGVTYKLLSDAIRSHTQLKIDSALCKKKPEDGEMPILMTCIPLYDEFSRCSGIRGICTDITMYKAIEQKVNNLSVQKMKMYVDASSSSGKKAE